MKKNIQINMLIMAVKAYGGGGGLDMTAKNAILFWMAPQYQT